MSIVEANFWMCRLKAFRMRFALWDTGGICPGEADIAPQAGMSALKRRCPAVSFLGLTSEAYRVAFRLAGVSLATRRRMSPAIPSKPDPISMREAGSGVADEGVAPTNPVNPVWLFRA